MSFIQEFKKFIMRGSVVDLTVGVIIGAAFNKIVTSLVNDVIMPPIGLLLGKVDFSSLFINLSDTHYNSLAEAKAAGAPTINYGQFINNVLDFLIVAFVIFVVIKQINHFRRNEKREEKAEDPTKECPYCLSKIDVKATRCPKCTSMLNEKEPEPSAT